MLIIFYSCDSFGLIFYHVTWISEFCTFMHSNYCPYIESPLTHLHLKSFEFRIEKKVPVFTIVTFFSKEYQKFIIELKLVTHLVPKLMDTVKELNKNLAPIIKIP